MAFTVTQRASNNNTTTASQTQVSSSFTPTASSRLFVFAFAERNFHAGTQNWGISNTGSLSFTLLDTSTIYSWNGDTLYAANCVGWYADVGGSPSSMTVTVDADAVATDSYFYSLVVFDVTGYDTGTPFAQASVDNGAELTGGDSHSGTLTLGSAPTSGNLVVAMFGSSQDTGGGFATPTGYTVLTNQSVGGYTGGSVFYHVTTTTAAVTCSDLGNTVGNWGGIIFEMKLGGVAVLTVSVTDNIRLSSSASLALSSIGVLSVNVTDIVAISDAITAISSAALISVTDTINISDAPSVSTGIISTLSASVTDTVAISGDGIGIPIAGTAVTGVLTVSTDNARYFENDSGIVMLSGFHTWYDLQDGGSSDPPSAFDYDTWLDYLEARGANLFKLWIMETAEDWPDVSPQYYSPHPWVRSGPGTAADGKLKFDLNTFDPNHFDRLRQRVLKAAYRNMYVIIQLFQGWQIDQKGMATGDPWAYHPFEDGNNINSIDGDTDNDGVGDESRDESISALQAIEEAYVEKVIDTLNDLDNVFFEISNEDGTYSETWQSNLVDHIHTYEAGKAKQHPVGLTKIWPSGTNVMLEKNNEWVSYDAAGADAVADGDYVSIYDTDHTVGLTDDHTWVWQSFCNGHYPLYMDEYDGAIYGTDKRLVAANEQIRNNTGAVLTYAAQMDLASATPQAALSSTSLCIARITGSPHTYLSYQDSAGGGNITLNLSNSTGVFTVEWFRTSNQSTSGGADVDGGGASTVLTNPWSEDAVVFLYQTTYDISVTDTISVSDAAQVETAISLVVTDTISVSDTPTARLESYVSVTDTLTVSDSAALSPSSFISVLDTISLSDATTVTESANIIAVSDTISLSDNTNLSLVAAGESTISVSDTIALSDTSSVAESATIISVTDTLDVSDAPTARVESYVSVTDTASLSDNASLSFSALDDLTISVSDTALLSDTVSLLGSAPQIAVSDLITLADNAGVGLNPLRLSVTDTMAFSDTVSVSLSVGLVVAVALTLQTRSNDLTLQTRSLDLTLKTRS